MMNRPLLLIAVLLLAAPGAARAQADAQTASWSRTLQAADTPEQRAEAAKHLGDSEDPEARPALCAALEDASEQVRAAAARGLQKLEALEALECLRARKGEKHPEVKEALRQAVGALEKLASRPPKHYVAFTGVEDSEGLLSPELVQAANARLRRRLVQVGALLAPEKENEDTARQVLRKKKLKGSRLKVEVRPGEGGGLKLTLLSLRYPGAQSLQGSVHVQAEGDDPLELLKALAPALVDEAAGTFAWGK